MSIESQIEAAKQSVLEKWDAEHPPHVYDAPYERPRDRDTFQDGFTAGYLAALRPFVLNPGEWIAMDNSEPPQVWVWFGHRDESAEPVRRLNLPSPSDIFGRGE